MAAVPKKLIAPLVLIVGLAVAYLVLTGKPAPEPREPTQRRAPSVDIVVAEPTQVTLSVTSQGSVAPKREINVVSQVAGIVEQVTDQFADGGFISADDVLVKIEDADYRFALIRARARVAEARQTVAQEKGVGRQAAREWRDVGSQEANDLFLRKPQLAAAEATLLSAEADVGEAQLDVERTAITVPFNGRISETHVDIGQYVGPGTVVARVYATDRVEIRLPLTDRQVALLDLPLSYEDHQEQVLRPVTLSARFASRQWQWEGKIVRTDASIDVDSRVVYAVVEVEQPFSRVPGSERPPLSIGLFVEAEIAGRRIADVTALPRSALRNDNAVLLVDTSDQLQQRLVRVLKTSERQVWVQGLADSERVVVSDLPVAVAGMTVTVRQARNLASGAR